jgi:hypothetical protein
MVARNIPMPRPRYRISAGMRPVNRSVIHRLTEKCSESISPSSQGAFCCTVSPVSAGKTRAAEALARAACCDLQKRGKPQPPNGYRRHWPQPSEKFHTGQRFRQYSQCLLKGP